jgi:hypothetical protein
LDGVERDAMTWEEWFDRPMDFKRVDKAMWLRQCVAHCESDRWSWEYYQGGIEALEKLEKSVHEIHVAETVTATQTSC